MHFNIRSAYAIYRREMSRAFRTAFQSILSPVLTTSLYFVVFGSVIGARMEPIGGVPYGAFIIPGLLMLTLLGETTSNASFGIYMPRFTGTIYELLSRTRRRGRNACRVCRRGGDQRADIGRDHPHHGDLFRRLPDRPSRLCRALHHAGGGKVSRFRLHPRTNLGRTASRRLGSSPC